jgi:hypothetical protein
VPTLAPVQAKLDEIVRYAVPDVGGQHAVHAATLANLGTEIATKRQECTTKTGQIAGFHGLKPAERFELGRRVDELEARVDAIAAERDVAKNYFDAQLGASLADLNTAKSLPNLKLTVPTLTGPHGGAILYGLPALQRMNRLIAGANVTGWVPTVWPGPRAAVRPGGPGLYLLPQISITVDNVAPAIAAGGSLTLELGPEIIVDWLFENAAHGLAYRDLKEKAEMVLNTKNRMYEMFKPSLVPSTGGKWKVGSRNYAFQLIVNAARTMIVTYFLTAS